MAIVDTVPQWLEDNQQLLLIAGGVTVSALALKYFLNKGRTENKEYPKNEVILFQMGRGPWAPSLSPYPLKLETYLRMAKISYQNEHGWYISRKGKTPYIMYNGEEIPDSQLIIEFLNKEKGVDLNGHLTDEQKAIGRAFLKMVEENLYWTIVTERWVDNGYEKFLNLWPQMSRFRFWFVRRHLKKELWGHGIGRHSKEERDGIMKKDMRALSYYLGIKKFFFGDEPSEVDCAIFGMLAQIKWQLKGSPQEMLLNGELSNLSGYCDRMKTRFWPDWDDCITHGHTREATK